MLLCPMRKKEKIIDKIVGKYKNYTVKYINGKIEIHCEDLGSDKDIEKNHNIGMNINMPNQMNINNANQMNMFNMQNQMMMNIVILRFKFR